MLRPLILSLVAVLAASSVSADSLVEAAKRERERRAALKQRAKLKNNEAIEKQPAAGSKLSELGQAGPASGAEPAASDAAAAAVAAEEAAEETAKEGEPEKDWPKLLSEARRKVAEIESELKNAERETLLLRRDQVYASDPTREFNRRGNLEESMQRQAKAQADLAEAQQELERLQREARRAGVPRSVYR